MEQVGSISYDARINTSDFSKDASKIEREVDSLASHVEKSGGRGFRNFANEASNSFNSVAGGIAALSKAAIGLLAGGVFGAGTFVKQASELQGITASFESMTGSAEEARKVLTQLNKFSFDTAFSSKDINDAARAFLGAGLRVDDLGKMLKNVGDIAGATGADLGQLTRPLTQSLAKGKLDTEDYYQILDSGAGKLGQILRQEVAERGLGEISKAFQEGKVTSDILFSAIEKSAAKGGFAFEGAIKQSRTFDGQMSNLMETISNVGLEILGVNKATGEIDKNGVFAKLSLAVQDATKWLTENKTQIKDISMFIIDNAVPAVTALAVAYTAAKIAAIGFSIAASANPIGVIVAAIVGLIAILTFLQLKFNIFGEAWDFIVAKWGQAGDFFAAEWASIVAVWNAAPRFFVNLWNGIVATFHAAGAAVGDAIGNAFRAVINGIISRATGILNGFIDSINTVINLVNKIPGVKIGKIGRLGIPQMAEGGIVPARPGGMLANIGEGGEAEAVIPLSKLDSIFNGDGKKEVTYNIGEITIGTEVDGERWLRKLTQNQEIVGKGLTPHTKYA